MFEIKKEEKKELFGRKEIEASFLGESLTFEKAKDLLSDKFKTSGENIAVKGINRKFGSAELSILAYIYESPEKLTKFEPKNKEKTAAMLASAEKKSEQKKSEQIKKEAKK